MPKYRKKPVEIEAIQYNGYNKTEIEFYFGVQLGEYNDNGIKREDFYLIIPTLEGNMKCMVNDYIIKDIAGELYPCKSDIFYQTYELIN